MSELEDLQAWLLEALRAEITRRYPSAADAFDTSPPQGVEEARKRGEQLRFPPQESWNTLLAGIASVRLGLVELDFTAQSLRRATTPQASWFFNQIPPLIASSCIERLEFLIKRMSRGAHPLVERSVGNALMLELKTQAARFEGLRHDVAHGPHLGLGKGGWLESAGNERLWELMALNKENGAEFVEDFLQLSLERRDQRFERIGPFATAVSNMIRIITGRLLAAAKEKASG